MENEKRRSFGGKLSGFENNDDRNKEKAHLKAYLRGQKKFRHGCWPGLTGNIPKYFDVIEIWS